jgi:tetratricopeptide (TPR) repeat protein
MRSAARLRSCVFAGVIFFLASRLALAQTNPPGFEEVIQRATAARERDDLPQAIELYRQAVQLKPEWSDGWWFLGSIEYEAEQYVASREDLTHHLDLVPEAGPAWALRGLCEFETGEYAQSLSDIQRALSLEPASDHRGDEMLLRYHEALLLTRAGNFEPAMREYAKLVRVKSPNEELLVGIGLAGLRTPLLPQDLKSDKKDLFAGAGRAAFLFLSGEKSSAQRQFQDLFQRYPAAENAHYLYGYLLSATDSDQALAEFKRELEVSPSNAKVELIVAWDLLMRNDSSTALAHAEKAVTEDPALPIADLVLGRAEVETGNVKVGIELLEKELQREPDNLEIHIALAKAFSESGNKVEARRERLLCLKMERSPENQMRR